VPTLRAFWRFVTGQALYVPIALMSQLGGASEIVERLLDAANHLGVVPTALARVLVQTVKPEAGAELEPAQWLRDFNPIALLVPCALGAFLVLSLGPSPGPRRFHSRLRHCLVRGSCSPAGRTCDFSEKKRGKRVGVSPSQ
jgi:hypothetical protein